MGETRSTFWNDSGLALNLDGTKIDQDNLDGGNRNISGPRWDILREMPREMKFKYDPFLDGFTEHGFLCGENHDGTGRITSSKRETSSELDSGLTQT